MTARSLYRALTDSGLAALNSSLLSSGNFRHLFGEAEVQVIDVDDNKEGPRNWPLGNTTANCSPVREHTIYEGPLPPSCPPVFNPGTNIALDAKGTKHLHEPLVRDFIGGIA